LGLITGPVPPRVDAHVTAGLLELIEHALERGWSCRRASGLLGLDEVRAGRWQARCAVDALDDRAPGGAPLHGLLGWERAAIVALFEGWAGIDRSHRKLAHRGSRLDLVHVSESTVHRVLAAEGLVVAAQPAREPTPRTPWPAWLEWKPQRVWAYDFTHFTRARRAVIAILDVVSRRWITTLVAAEESSTQVEVAFTDALVAEDLLAVADGRATAALRAALADGDREQVVSLTADGQRPLLLAISDNGPQMRSHSTREFLAGVAIAQQFRRPPHSERVESARGAVPGLLPVRFPGPLAEPAVRLSTQRALHGVDRQGWPGKVQGLGIVLPR